MKRVPLLLSIRRYSAASGEAIAIPNRIKRGPTDLLKALASTVKQVDTTGGHHKYIDDPFMLPVAQTTSRTYALAREAGRKAAKQLAAEWPTLLYYDEDFPRLSAFRPQKKLIEETGDTEEILLDRMNRHWVENAVAVYRNIRSKNGDISPETQIELLELMCWSNCEDDRLFVESDWDEERWYKNFLENQKAGSGDKTLRSSWKEGGEADILFEEIEPKTGRAYSVKISGMAKHLKGENAYNLLLTARQNQIPLSLEAYNSVIPACYHFAGTPKGRWAKALEILTWMKNDGISPNLATFNAALALLARGRTWKQSEKEAVKVIQEMINLGIEPSVGCYKSLLSVFDRAPAGLLRGLMSACFDRLESLTEDLTVRDEADELFFTAVIFLIKNKLEDVEMANRLDGIFKKGNNSLLITNSSSAQVYYTCFLRLMADKLPTKEFMVIYRKLVPFHYCPDNETVVSILENIDRNGEWGVVPELYTDFVSMGMIWRERTVAELIRLLKDAHFLDDAHKQQMAAIAWDINERLDSQYGIPGFVPYILWRPEWVVRLAVILARTGDLERACAVFKKLLPDFQAEKPEEERIRVAAGAPEEGTISKYFEFFMNRGSFAEVYDVLLVADKYMLSCAKELALSYKHSDKAMTDHERRLLEEFVSNSSSLGIQYPQSLLGDFSDRDRGEF